jgi:thioesterase domain-containing protein
LVPIKPSGRRPPVFLIHGDGLNVLAFQHLLPLFPEDQPLYGLQVKGLDGKALPPDTIAAIAADYLKDIRTVQPQGPYYLGGYSFGGLVAYEMAHQLLAQEESLGLLAMLDTNISNEDFYCPKQNTMWGKVKRQFPKLLFNLKNLWQQPAATWSYQQFILGQRFQQWKGKNALVETEDVDHEDKILARITAAYKTYRLQPLAHDMVIFRCQERFYYINDPHYLGWKKFVKGKISVLDVPGDHRSFLLPPQAAYFAQALLSVLPSNAQP